MQKQYYIKADMLKQVYVGNGAGYATDIIMVEGSNVGYMYREEPNNQYDSGWRFMSGRETQEYTDEPSNWAMYDLNTIANYDPDIIKYLDSSIGSEFGRTNDLTELLPIKKSPNQAVKPSP